MSSAILQLATIFAVSLAVAGLTWLAKPIDLKTPPTATVCDPAAIAEDEICFSDIPDGALMIDARSRGEWQENGLPDSLLWNFDPKESQQEFEAQAALQVLEAPFVVVYCGSEACGTSRQVADRIRELDLGPPIKVLHGGWHAISGSHLDEKFE